MFHAAHSGKYAEIGFKNGKKWIESHVSGAINPTRKRMPLAEKIRLEHFLSLTELSKARGLSMKKLSAFMQNREMNGFPLFEGKVRLADFDAWYRRLICFQIQEEQDKQPFRQSVSSPLHHVADRPHEPAQKYGSAPALQPFR